MMYLVDANVLIDAKNRYYGFDIAPGFWRWLLNAHSSGLMCSLEVVRDELVAGSDELADWAKANGSFFHPIDEATTAHFPTLSQWAASQNYNPSALAAFTGNAADYQLVAYARAHDHIVVTHETPAPNTRKRVKIPDACTAIGVTSVGPFEVLRRTGAALELRI